MRKVWQSLRAFLQRLLPIGRDGAGQGIHRESIPKMRAKWKLRVPLPEAAFLAKLGLTGIQAKLATAMRDEIANYTKMTSEVLYPTDELSTLLDLINWKEQPVEWSDLIVNVWCDLASEVGLRFTTSPDELVGKWERTERTGNIRTIADLVHWLADQMDVSAS